MVEKTTFESSNENSKITVERKTTIVHETILTEEILTRSVSEEDLNRALEYICQRDGANKKDWAIQLEAEEWIKNQWLMEAGISPREPIVAIQKPVDNTDVALSYPLMNEIALIKEWYEEDDSERSEVLAVMRTIEDFIDVINKMRGDPTSNESLFTDALPGHKVAANDIYSKLISMSKKDCKGRVTISKNQFDSAKKYVQSYNKKYPTFTFVKVPDNTKKDDKINIPSVEIGGKKMNRIFINLKINEMLSKLGVRPLDVNFEKGYIPILVYEFVGGNLPEVVQAITFSKTIAIGRESIDMGYFLKLITGDAKKDNMDDVRKYLDIFADKYSKEIHPRFPNCVVGISIPK